MSDSAYQPLNRLKPIGEDIWIVDGPTIPFGALGVHFPFPTRMTVVHVAGGLFIHSPTALDPALKAAIAALGRPRWIVAPNTIHYWWIPEWHHAFPDAAIFLAPGVVKRSKGRISCPHSLLDHDDGWPWSAALETWVIKGSGITEVDFFHHASRTLILADLIENFEADRIPSRWMRWLARLGGVLDPHGAMPRDMRLAYRSNRSRLRAVVREMIALEPRNVVLAHGKWYRDDGTAQLRRAFDWLLPDAPVGLATGEGR